MAGPIVTRAEIEAHATASVGLAARTGTLPPNPYPELSDAAAEWDRLVEARMVREIAGCGAGEAACAS